MKRCNMSRRYCLTISINFTSLTMLEFIKLQRRFLSFFHFLGKIDFPEAGLPEALKSKLWGNVLSIDYLHSPITEH